MRIQSTRHVLAVNDLAASAKYYIDVLGFSRDLAAENWEFLSLGDFHVMLGSCPDEVPASETNNHSYFAHVMVSGVDELYSKLRSRGAEILQEPEDKPWGAREFGIRTPDGHRMVFAHRIA